DGFVTKLAPGGSIVYSTFLGGSSGDVAHGIAVDGAGNAYVVEETFSSDAPTTPGAFDTTYNGDRDGYVAKLSADGSTLIYGTFLGGSSSDIPYGIALDAVGNTYVTGSTASSNFPTTPDAYQPAFHAVNDVLLVKLNTAGSALIYGTFI